MPFLHPIPERSIDLSAGYSWHNEATDPYAPVLSGSVGGNTTFIPAYVHQFGQQCMWFSPGTGPAATDFQQAYYSRGELSLYPADGALDTALMVTFLFRMVGLNQFYAGFFSTGNGPNYAGVGVTRGSTNNGQFSVTMGDGAGAINLTQPGKPAAPTRNIFLPNGSSDLWHKAELVYSRSLFQFTLDDAIDQRCVGVSQVNESALAAGFVTRVNANPGGAPDVRFSNVSYRYVAGLPA